MESAGATYYGTLDVGDLGANATYTFSGTSGTVHTTGNLTWGDGLEYAAGTAAIDYNTTNLKITATEIDTIQGISTAASPTFANITDSGLTATRVVVAGASGLLSDDANFVWNASDVLEVGAASNNTFIGQGVIGAGNMSGATDNTIVGYQGGYSLIGGDYNTFVGDGAGYDYTHGSGSTFIGYRAGYNTTTANNNLYVGGYAGYSNQTGADNAILGSYAGYFNTATGNTFVGKSAGYSNTSGGANITIGASAGYYNQTGGDNVILGYQAGYGVLNNSYIGNTFIGYQSGYSNTTGAYNFFGGWRAGYSNTAGQSNVAIGTLAGTTNSTGGENVYIGREAGEASTSSFNTMIGYRAGHNTSTGNSNVFIGNGASYYNETGSYNTFIGTAAGQGASGQSYSNNTFIGYQSGYDVTTGGDNTILGYRSGYNITTAADNVILGHEAGYTMTTATGNVLLGHQAGYSETGSNKLYIDNSNTATPLIYGDFSTDALTIYGVQEIDTGTATGIALTVDQDDLDQTALDFDVNNTSGDILNMDWGGATTLTGILQAVDIDLTNVTADGTNAAYGVHVNDFSTTTASAEYGIYVQGANFDYSIVTEGDMLLNNAGAEIVIMESAGDTYYGTIDVGDLAANATYTITGPTGDIVTTTTEAVFTGGGRHSRKIQLNAEYSGGVLSTFYGTGTDASITGTMTSDAEPSADLLRTYYEWDSGEADLNYYTVAVRVTLPEDFAAWEESNAVQVDIDTESTNAANNLISIYIYNGDDTPATAVTSSLSNVSSVADTWETVTIDDSAIDEGGAPDWDAGGETAVIYLRMGSKDNNFVRIGDIKLNYLSKW